jgi:biopolymer transport protein ExbB/TolQ
MQPTRKITKVPAQAKKRASQVNMMQRSEDEMGKFDNASATSVSMGITALIGLGVEVGFYLFVLVFRISPNTQIISDYFYERGWVPYVLTYLACWSFAILFLKRKKLKGQLNIMQFKLLPEDISRDIRVENLPHFGAHINRLGFDPSQSFLLTRILRGLEHFSVRKNHTETADMLKSQSEIDATMVDSSYVLIKVFIWAIPILGFIGTVLGISDAVSSFGGEMGAAADIEVIKEQLGQVTGGLSEAFDTTLVSLIFSLWVMFPTSVMQKNEEDLLNKVDEYCNEYFLKRLREPNLEHNLSSSEMGQSGATLERIENLQAYLLQLQESQSVVAQQMTQVASQFTQIMENTSIEEQADQH